MTTSFLLPQRNLKARDLREDLFPHKEIIKEYNDAGQSFDFDSDATGHDRTYRIFWSLVNGNVRLREQKLDQQISQVYRIKDSKGEWLMYHILLFGLNHKGEQVNFSDLVGRIDQIPIFERKYDEHTGEVVSGPLIYDHRTEYTVPFTKAKLDEILEFATENVSFAIEGKGTANRTLSCSLEEIRDMEWDDLVKALNAWRHTDWYRTKQLIQQNQGGAK